MLKSNVLTTSGTKEGNKQNSLKETNENSSDQKLEKWEKVKSLAKDFSAQTETPGQLEVGVQTESSSTTTQARTPSTSSSSSLTTASAVTTRKIPW